VRVKHHEGRKGVDHTDRKVEFAANYHHDLAGRQDRNGCRKDDQVRDIAPRQEGWRGALKIDHQEDTRDQDAGLSGV